MEKHEKQFKTTILWKAQYQPRINLIKKVYPKVHAKLIKLSVTKQIMAIDLWQSKGLFRRN